MSTAFDTKYLNDDAYRHFDNIRAQSALIGENFPPMWVVLKELLGPSPEVVENMENIALQAFESGGALPTSSPAESPVRTILLSAESGLDVNALHAFIAKKNEDALQSRSSRPALEKGKVSLSGASASFMLRAQQGAFDSSLESMIPGSSPDVITNDHLWLSALSDGEVFKMLTDHGLKPGLARDILRKSVSKAFSPPEEAGPDETPEEEKTYIERFSIDLTQQYRDGTSEPVIGRQSELREVFHALQRLSTHHALLIGPDGVGKNSVVRLLAQQIAEGKAPSDFANHSVLQVNLEQLLSSSTEDSFTKTLEFLKEVRRKGNVILDFEDVNLLAGNGNAEQLLRSFLTETSIRCIGTTSPAGYKFGIEPNDSLMKAMTKVDVKEQTPDQVMIVLRSIKSRFERFHGIEIDDAALLATVDLCDRHIKAKPFPEKALEVLDVACAILKSSLTGVHPRLEEADAKVIELTEGIENAQKLKRGLEVRDLKKKLKKAEEKAAQLHEAFDKEEAIRDNIRVIRDELSLHEDKLRDMDEERIPADLAVRAQLLYSTIPDFKAKLEEAEKPLKDLKEIFLEEKLSLQHISATVSGITGLEAGRLFEDDSEALRNFDRELKRYVIGQDHAVSDIRKALVSSAQRSKKETKPRGCFLMLGTTGVGKSYTAKMAAMVQGRPSIVIDMTEYGSFHNQSKLVGSPPGYQGSAEGGILTEFIKNNPNGVIIFDEIDKADAKVLDLLMPLLDEGRMRDGKNDLVDAKGTTIFLTGNTGADNIFSRYEKILADERTDPTDEEMAELKEIGQQAMLDHGFRREFLARLTPIMFLPLSRNIAKTITQTILEGVVEKYHEKNINLVLTDEMPTFFTDEYYSAKNGTRPITNGIQESIISTLSDHALERAQQDNPTQLTVDVVGGKLVWGGCELTDEEFEQRCTAYYDKKEMVNEERMKVSEKNAAVKINILKRVSDPALAGTEIPAIPESDYFFKDLSESDPKNKVMQKRDAATTASKKEKKKDTVLGEP